MTTTTDNDRPDADIVAGTDLPDAMRWQLRALRCDEPPSRDLWPDIAGRLQQPAVTTARSQRRWIAPVALAATLVIALGATGLLGDHLPLRLPSTTPASTTVTVVQREAAGLARHYDAALHEVAIAQVEPGIALQSTLDELDRSLGLIHHALSQDPDSRLLLEQLRRTYSHRLALAQRVAYS